MDEPLLNSLGYRISIPGAGLNRPDEVLTLRLRPVPLKTKFMSLLIVGAGMLIIAVVTLLVVGSLHLVPQFYLSLFANSFFIGFFFTAGALLVPRSDRIDINPEGLSITGFGYRFSHIPYDAISEVTHTKWAVRLKVAVPNQRDWSTNLTLAFNRCIGRNFLEIPATGLPLEAAEIAEQISLRQKARQISVQNGISRSSMRAH